MLHLYRAECARFAPWAIGASVIHVFVLLFLDQLFPLFQANSEIQLIAAAIYGGGGALLGVYQTASYAPMNRWINLLHRPLAPSRIFFAVSGAGATVLIFAVLAPLLILAASQVLQVDRFVDARHIWLIISATCLALIGFLIGTYLVLAPRRYGWTVLVLLIFLVGDAVGRGAIIMQGIVIALLALLLLTVWLPDRADVPRRGAALPLVAAVCALAAYFALMVVGGFAYQAGLMAVRQNVLVNSPPPGGLVEAARASDRDLLDAGLAVSPTEAARSFRRTLDRMEIVALPTATDRLPVRGELLNSGALSFGDTRRSIEWTFSHDANAFRGLRLKDRTFAGWLRPDSGFGAPPMLLEKGAMISAGTLFRFDPVTEKIQPELALPKGEVIVSAPTEVGDRLAVLGDRALYYFDKKSLRPGAQHWRAAPLPGAIGDLRRLHIARVQSGWLISFFFGREAIEGPASARQEIVLLGDDGNVRPLAKRRLGPDVSTGLRFRAYWLSPAIHASVAALEAVGSPNAPEQRRAPIQAPPSVWVGAVVLSLLAAVAALKAGQSRKLGRRATAIWTVASAFTGLPMLAALWLITTKRTKQA